MCAEGEFSISTRKVCSVHSILLSSSFRGFYKVLAIILPLPLISPLQDLWLMKMRIQSLHSTSNPSMATLIRLPWSIRMPRNTTELSIPLQTSLYLSLFLHLKEVTSCWERIY